MASAGRGPRAGEAYIRLTVDDQTRIDDIRAGGSIEITSNIQQVIADIRARVASLALRAEIDLSHDINSLLADLHARLAAANLDAEVDLVANVQEMVRQAQAKLDASHLASEVDLSSDVDEWARRTQAKLDARPDLRSEVELDFDADRVLGIPAMLEFDSDRAMDAVQDQINAGVRPRITAEVEVEKDRDVLAELQRKFDEAMEGSLIATAQVQLNNTDLHQALDEANRIMYQSRLLNQVMQIVPEMDAAQFANFEKWLKENDISLPINIEIDHDRMQQIRAQFGDYLRAPIGLELDERSASEFRRYIREWGRGLDDVELRVRAETAGLDRFATEMDLLMREKGLMDKLIKVGVQPDMDGETRLRWDRFMQSLTEEQRNYITLGINKELSKEGVQRGLRDIEKDIKAEAERLEILARLSIRTDLNEADRKIVEAELNRLTADQRITLEVMKDAASVARVEAELKRIGETDLTALAKLYLNVDPRAREQAEQIIERLSADQQVMFRPLVDQQAANRVADQMDELAATRQALIMPRVDMAAQMLADTTLRNLTRPQIVPLIVNVMNYGQALTIIRNAAQGMAGLPLLERMMNRVMGLYRDLPLVIGQLGVKATQWGLAATAIGTIAGALPGILSGIGAMSGGLAGVLTAVGAIVGGVFTVRNIFADLGNAQSGHPANFYRTMRAVNAEFATLRREFQGIFFERFTGSYREMMQTIRGYMTPALLHTVRYFGYAFAMLAQYITDLARSDGGQVFDQLGEVIRRMMPGVTYLATTFLRLATNLLPAVADGTDVVVGWLRELYWFVRTSDLDGWARRGADQMVLFGGIIRNVAGTARDLFAAIRAGSDDSEVGLSLLYRVTGDLRTGFQRLHGPVAGFVQSAQAGFAYLWPHVDTVLTLVGRLIPVFGHLTEVVSRSVSTAIGPLGVRLDELVRSGSLHAVIDGLGGLIVSIEWTKAVDILDILLDKSVKLMPMIGELVNNVLDLAIALGPGMGVVKSLTFPLMNTLANLLTWLTENVHDSIVGFGLFAMILKAQHGPAIKAAITGVKSMIAQFGTLMVTQKALNAQGIYMTKTQIALAGAKAKSAAAAAKASGANSALVATITANVAASTKDAAATTAAAAANGKAAAAQTATAATAAKVTAATTAKTAATTKATAAQVKLNAAQAVGKGGAGLFVGAIKSKIGGLTDFIGSAKAASASGLQFKGTVLASGKAVGPAMAGIGKALAGVFSVKGIAVAGPIAAGVALARAADDWNWFRDEVSTTSHQFRREQEQIFESMYGFIGSETAQWIEATKRAYEEMRDGTIETAEAIKIAWENGMVDTAAAIAYGLDLSLVEFDRYEEDMVAAVSRAMHNANLEVIGGMEVRAEEMTKGLEYLREVEARSVEEQVEILQNWQQGNIDITSATYEELNLLVKHGHAQMYDIMREGRDLERLANSEHYQLILADEAEQHARRMAYTMARHEEMIAEEKRAWEERYGVTVEGGDAVTEAVNLTYSGLPGVLRYYYGNMEAITEAYQERRQAELEAAEAKIKAEIQASLNERTLAYQNAYAEGLIDQATFHQAVQNSEQFHQDLQQRRIDAYHRRINNSWDSHLDTVRTGISRSSNGVFMMEKQFQDNLIEQVQRGADQRNALYRSANMTMSQEAQNTFTQLGYRETRHWEEVRHRTDSGTRAVNDTQRRANETTVAGINELGAKWADGHSDMLGTQEAWAQTSAGGYARAFQGYQRTFNHYIGNSVIPKAYQRGLSRMLNDQQAWQTNSLRGFNTWASSAEPYGERLMQSIARGVDRGQGALSHAVQRAMNRAAAQIPSSPAEEGVFSGRNSPGDRGRRMMESLTDGVVRGTKGFVDAISDAMEQASDEMYLRGYAGLPAPGGYGPGRVTAPSGWSDATGGVGGGLMDLASSMALRGDSMGQGPSMGGVTDLNRRDLDYLISGLAQVLYPTVQAGKMVHDLAASGRRNPNPTSLKW